MAKDRITDAIVSRYRTSTPSLPSPLADHWSWQLDASCRFADTAIFYPPNESRGEIREMIETRAKAVCRECPVRKQCRDHALEAGEPYGIWGGTTPKERALLSHSQVFR
jgi:WhiB family redox-sensing transcriptional regulator